MALKSIIGFGIAGNFAGHLEQAGEAADFKLVTVQSAVQPKAIFPFYVPNFAEGFLSIYPLSADTIAFPNDADNLQIEPEVALLCDICYDAQHMVTALLPRAFAAFNDCSIRRPNAHKIADKKNWGANSKGLSSQWIAIDDLTPGGKLDDYRIACFHLRDGKLNTYGIDSPVVGYSYFHQQLLDWIVDRMNHQQDIGPTHHIRPLLETAGFPQQAVISIGATRYTEFGETHFLQPGDVSMVVVYNGKKFTHDTIFAMAEKQQFSGDLSALVQRVEA
ncbi:DUF5718 family protein [Spirabiliibacterium falconis]|uniref:DUF5718 family protein n=1 Tax=Spirabiliibacterium falconis TaxID=572023 RepID=UPI001AAD19AD|nr:DUF5718 family protein [Spirabiliibacterium falconis]MBE2893642.1 hypothetical protein [Spirabiliibacterium falconis]